MIRFNVLFFTVYFLCSFALAQEPVAIDSRIKTFIYTKNQVFKIDANYGYQSFIEFAENEKVKTIAIGDGVSWNINPSGNKIFLRPFEKTGKTNMTVITDKRTYTFDLVARSDSEEMDGDLAYIARFFYPKEDDELDLGVDADQEDSFALDGKTYNIAYDKLHQNYSVNGDQFISPRDVLDNSYVTFFRFAGKIPRVFVVNKDKSENQLKMVRFKDYFIVDGVHNKLRLRYKDRIAEVTNNDF